MWTCIFWNYLHLAWHSHSYLFRLYTVHEGQARMSRYNSQTNCIDLCEYTYCTKYGFSSHFDYSKWFQVLPHSSTHTHTHKALFSIFTFYTHPTPITLGTIWGSIPCPRTLQHVAWRLWGLNHQPSGWLMTCLLSPLDIREIALWSEWNTET